MHNTLTSANQAKHARMCYGQILASFAIGLLAKMRPCGHTKHVLVHQTSPALTMSR